MNDILALDLGTHTGWCTIEKDDEEWLWTGTFNLATPAEVTQWKRENLDRRCDRRVVRLHHWLSYHEPRTKLVVFEDVEFCQTTLQCQLWSALRAAVWCAFPESKIECVPVHVIKKFATGNPKAQKEDMAAALARREPKRFKLDKPLKKKHLLYDQTAATWGRGDEMMTDNAIDAYWIAQWAKENIKR